MVEFIPSNITVLVHRAGRTLTCDWSVNRIPKVIIVSACKRSLEQGNVYTGVLSVRGGGGAKETIHIISL